MKLAKVFVCSICWLLLISGTSKSDEISESKVRESLQNALETLWFGPFPQSKASFDQGESTYGGQVFREMNKRLMIVNQNSQHKRLSLVKANYSSNYVSNIISIEKLPESNKYRTMSLDYSGYKWFCYDIGKRKIEKILKIEKNSSSSNEHKVYFTYKYSYNDLGKILFQGEEGSAKAQAIITFDIFSEKIVVNEIKEGPIDKPEIWNFDSKWEKKVGEKTELIYKPYFK